MTEDPQAANTLPPNLSVGFRGIPEDHPLVGAFISVLKELGSVLDLQLLDGVTVGLNMQDVVDSVDLGFESETAREFTNDESAVCVAKAMRVRRGDQVRSHVVFNANFIATLSEDGEPFWDAAHIVAHEMGHVHDLARVQRVFPDLLLNLRFVPDLWTNALRNDALSVWDEYAACRLTGKLSNREKLIGQYTSVYCASADGVLLASREAIKRYRNHGDLGKLYAEVHKALITPLKYLAYLAGHLDSLGEDNTLGNVLPNHSELFHAGLDGELWLELRRLWECRDDWTGFEELDGLVRVFLTAFSKAGIDIQLKPEGGTSIHIPFTAETMPNGEADMLLIQLLGNNPKGQR